MIIESASAQAHPNIAFIKYWGNLDSSLRIPVNGSISMNLGGLCTQTTVTYDNTYTSDEFILSGRPVTGTALFRVSAMLDRVRKMAGFSYHARVESMNNFPTGAGIASSASAFAALSIAASVAAGLKLNEIDLSRLARTGSGSACRSVPQGFVEWIPGNDDDSSYAISIASPNHWDLFDCIAIVNQTQKHTGSTEGHHLANTSPLQTARLVDATRRLSICRTAIEENDFAAFTNIVEQDSNMMHAVMVTSCPSLLYWQPATIAVMHAVVNWRKNGLPVCFTIDAGPNVHVICLSDAVKQVVNRLSSIPGVQKVLTAHPGSAAHLINTD